VAIAAYIPCCISLLAPALAWLGIVGLGAFATQWYWAGIVVFMLGLAALFYWYMQRRGNCQVSGESGTCNCESNCNISS
jgi:hypothetical protein